MTANLCLGIPFRSATARASGTRAGSRGFEDDRADLRPTLLKEVADASDRDIPAAGSREKLLDFRCRPTKRKKAASLRGCGFHTSSTGGHGTCEGGLLYPGSSQ